MSPLTNIRKLLVSFAICGFAVLASYATANATPFVYTLTQGNPGLQACAGCTGPYGTVTVNQTSSTTATITFQGATQGTNIYLFGGNGAVAVNFNGGPVTLLTTTPAGVDATLSDTGTSQTEDGFGTFNFALDNFDGFTAAFSTVTFTVSCPTCNWLADSSNVLANNSQGNAVAGHIFVSCPDCTGARATGYASNGTPSTETPEPATMILLGTGLLGVGATARRFRKSRK